MYYYRIGSLMVIFEIYDIQDSLERWTCTINQVGTRGGWKQMAKTRQLADHANGYTPRKHLRDTVQRYRKNHPKFSLTHSHDESIKIEREHLAKLISQKETIESNIRLSENRLYKYGVTP